MALNGGWISKFKNEWLKKRIYFIQQCTFQHILPCQSIYESQHFSINDIVWSLLVALDYGCQLYFYLYQRRINKTQQNNKYRLCGDWDETISHISKCSKLAQKEYKNRHDWVGKVIHWKSYKKLKSDHTNKWYMRNPESTLENETHKPQ